MKNLPVYWPQRPLIMAICITLLFAPAVHAVESLPYKNSALPVEQRVADLLARMTLEEKVWQMAMGERALVSNKDLAKGIGSMLNGGGHVQGVNTVAAWDQMIEGYQANAAKSRLAIPVLYGLDSVHGVGGVINGATMFPQQIGLAATGDEKLMQKIGQINGREMAALGVYWNFAPMVSVVNDERWGRTYESLGEDTATVTRLARAYVAGYQASLKALDPKAPTPLATAKHFIGDGAAGWNTSTTKNATSKYRIDQGDSRGDEAALLKRSLPPYQALIDEGVGSVMTSFSSWNGTKVHGSKALITDLLKGKLKFDGLVVSDWDAISQLPGDYHAQVVAGINAGIDIAMQPNDFSDFVDEVTESVQKGSISQARIDDAVTRILRVKFRMGLFENNLPLVAAKSLVGSDAHRAVAREAVQKSLVLLKNSATLPLAKGAGVTRILVAGSAAHDMGWQSGGWTMGWQGVSGNNNLTGVTMVDGLKQVAAKNTQIEYEQLGQFSAVNTQKPADVGIVFVGEAPYAEGMGDRDIDELKLSQVDLSAIDNMRSKVKKLVVVLVAGRPRILGDVVTKADALVMAWLPGTEGGGVADVLFGKAPFSGHLPMAWPKDAASFKRADEDVELRKAATLFPLGFGLKK
ncbi:MAG: glycoside hydrolase family 3 protein [Pseudomonadota bacterium]